MEKLSKPSFAGFERSSIVLLPHKDLPYVPEGLLLTLVCKHSQKLLKEPLGVWMYQNMRFSVLEIQKRTLIVVVLAFVYLACSHPVAEHLHNVFQRHLHRNQILRDRRVISPILKMVAVAPFVVEPCT